MIDKIKYVPIIYNTSRFIPRKKGFYHLVEDPDTGQYNHKIFITDPYSDLSGKVAVDPISYYGLTEEWLKHFEKVQ